MEVALGSHNASAVKRLLGKDKKKKIIGQTYAICYDGTALHIACASGDIDIIDILMKYKADINARNSLLETPLHIACVRGDPTLINRLLEYDPDVTLKTEEGDTALHLLIQQKHGHNLLIQNHNIFNTLKQKGANLVERNEEGNTPLHMACLKGADKNAMWLLKEGIDINISNKQGETPLHIVARLGSKSLTSVLILGGASPSRCGAHGTPRDAALRAERKEIVELMDSLTDNIAPGSKSIVINGKELNLDNIETMIAKMKKLLKYVNQQVKQVVTSPNTTIDYTKKSKEYKTIIEVLEINCIPLREEKIEKKNLFSGNLLFRETNSDDFDLWAELWCRIEDTFVSIYTGSPFKENDPPTKLRRVPLQCNLSFKIFSNNRRRLSILLYDGNTKEEHYAVDNEIELVKCLKSWVFVSCKPIEYIGDDHLMNLVDEALTIKIPSADSPGINRLNARKVRTLSSSSSIRRVGRIKKQRGSAIFGIGTPREEKEESVDMTVVNGTIRTTNFQTFLFASLFSSSFKMGVEDNVETVHSYYMTSGTISDLMQFILIHSTPELFGGNNDCKAFYLSYYKHATPSEVLSLLEDIWNEHKQFPFPEPFSNYPVESRLYHFILQFVVSPFVLMESDKEIQFRSDLVSFYENHVPGPGNEEYSTQNLKTMFQTVKKAQEKRRISSVCNLNSLLLNTDKDSGSSLTPFHVLSLAPETVAAQIAIINADLFRQMKVSELLDLRYQKNKEFAVGLSQLHHFSNKIYLMVPSTILELEGESQQVACLKTWISIAEKLMEYRDYNSCVQILNGVSESSILRLKYLKEGLTTKWIERFVKLQNAFAPESSYKNYRQLLTDAPTIPFVGVALKDITFAYDGNPDELEDGVNFRKMRITSDILHSLHLSSAEYYDYSFLPFNPIISQSILEYMPQTQDELYARSKFISNSKNAASDSCEDIPLLRNEIKNLHEEVNQLKEALQKAHAVNRKKEMRISALKAERKDPRTRFKQKKKLFTTSVSSLDNSVPLIAVERRKSEIHGFSQSTNSIGSSHSANSMGLSRSTNSMGLSQSTNSMGTTSDEDLTEPSEDLPEELMDNSQLLLLLKRERAINAKLLASLPFSDDSAG